MRTALFNWLFARQHGGQFILRIDDTDQQRNMDQTLPPILDGFRWLGIDWDEGPQVGGPYAPYFQSQRGDRYRAVVQQLLEAGAAYRDYARAEELQEERTAAEGAGKTFVYSRRWMANSDDEARRFEAEGRQAVVRLKMPREGLCRFHDLIRGDVEFAWSNEQDHVIQRPDGTCLYHLASVVDDFDFRITHVIRAVEHLSNTPRQLFIIQSLGIEPPVYAHLPYVAEPGSQKKLSKRKIEQYLKTAEFQKLYEQGKAIAERIGHPVTPESFNPVLTDFYRVVGFLPAAIVNYLFLLGWSLDDKTEDFSRDEMIRHFSLERVNASPASFDTAKLMSFEERYMQRVPAKQKPAMMLPFLQRAGLAGDPPACELGPKLLRIAEAAADRIRVAGDILQYEDLFVADEQLTYDEKAFQKRIAVAGMPELLQRLSSRLQGVDPFTAANLEGAVHHFLEVEGIKIGQIVHAVRVAVTGKAVGFGLFETMEILGRHSCLKRIERAVQRQAAQT